MRDVKNIYVVGRQNPDVDSVASTIGYAEFKKTVDKDNNYIAAVSGNVDLSTQKILSRFSVSLPKYILDLRLRVDDVMTRNVIQVNKNTPVTEVFKIMLKNDLLVIPVVEENGSFFGYFGMIDIARKSISSVMPDIFRKIKTSINMISKAVSGDVVNSSSGNDTFIANVIMGVVDPEGLMKVVERFDPENIVMILGNREDLQERAIELGVRCLIISNGYSLSDDMLKKAKEKDVAIILSEYDAFATAGLVEWSAPVETLVDRATIHVDPKELIDDIKESVYGSNHRAAVVVDSDGKVMGILTRTDIIKYNRRKVILIDHSSSTNAPKGIFRCDILEIIDHHRLGDIQTGIVTRYRIEPWGSTSSIVADEFAKHGIKPSDSTAMLLASGIITNTDFLSKEKTQENDIKTLKWICEIYNKNINNLVGEIKRVINS
jgi:manganese-dependent inorganic pyrophosphatase